MCRWLLLGLALSAASLAGCASHSAPRKVVTYAIIPAMADDPAFAFVQRGAMKAARDLEAEHPDTKYNIIYESSQSGLASDQATAINTLASRKVDGISVSAIDPNAVVKPIDDAVSAGVPVIYFGPDAPSSRAMSYLNVDNVALGNTLADQCLYAVDPHSINLALMVGNRNLTGEFALMSGRSSDGSLNDRLKGVRQILGRFPKLTVLPTLYCDANTAQGVREIDATMRAHPKLRGWILLGGWPLFAKGALDCVDPSVTKVVAADGFDPGRDYMRQGKVQCLVAQRSFDWGQSSVHILENIRIGFYKKVPKFVNPGYDVIVMQTDSNERKFSGRGVQYRSLDEYDEVLKDWNSGPLPAFHWSGSWQW